MTAGSRTPVSSAVTGWWGGRAIISVPVCRMVAGEAIVSREESPGSVEQRQSLTATGGDPRESATETIPPSTFTSFVSDVGRVDGNSQS